MDSTTLRLILLVVGIAFLAGIYLWDTRRRNNGAEQAKRREPPEISDEISSTEVQEQALGDETAAASQEDELPSLSATDEVEALGGEERIFIDESPSEPIEPLGEQQELFSFSAQEESPLDVPTKLIQINLIARSGHFSGQDIVAATRDTGLQAGEMDIYHRYASDGSRKTLFSMASLVEPGVFPLQAMETFSTPGLLLFCQLPGPGDSLAIFSDMLFTAERLAATLDGELQDETHSALTKQTVEHIRSQIMEHRRLVQLARSKR
jgi:cell division protein ZipA